MNAPEHTPSLTHMLKQLLKLNQQRAQTYRTTYTQTKDNKNLSSLFYEKSKQSEDFASYLEDEIGLLQQREELKEEHEPEVRSGRRVNTVCDVTTGQTPVFETCQQAEEETIQAYDEALHADVRIPAEMRQMLVQQQTAIKKSKETVAWYGSLNLRPNHNNYNNGFT